MMESGVKLPGSGTNRREILAGVAATALLATVKSKIGFAGRLLARRGEMSNNEQLLLEIERKIELIRTLYGIEVDIKPQRNEDIEDEHIKEIKFEESSLAQQDHALTWLLDGLTKYPPELIGRANICKIKIVSNLFIKKDKDFEKVDGLAVHDKFEIFLEAGQTSSQKKFGWSDEESFNLAFHHDVFHFLEHRLMGEEINRQWIELNEEKDKAYSNREGEEIKKGDGFIFKQGRENSKEDRATIFSAMLNNSMNIWGECNKDKILQAKVDFLKRKLFEISSGLMNDEYWRQLKDGKLPNNFFSKQ